MMIIKIEKNEDAELSALLENRNYILTKRADSIEIKILDAEPTEQLVNNIKNAMPNYSVSKTGEKVG